MPRYRIRLITSDSTLPFGGVFCSSAIISSTVVKIILHLVIFPPHLLLVRLSG